MSLRETTARTTHLLQQTLVEKERRLRDLDAEMQRVEQALMFSRNEGRATIPNSHHPPLNSSFPREIVIDDRDRMVDINGSVPYHIPSDEMGIPPSFDVEAAKSISRRRGRSRSRSRERSRSPVPRRIVKNADMEVSERDVRKTKDSVTVTIRTSRVEDRRNEEVKRSSDRERTDRKRVRSPSPSASKRRCSPSRSDRHLSRDRARRNAYLDRKREETGKTRMKKRDYDNSERSKRADLSVQEEVKRERKSSRDSLEPLSRQKRVELSRLELFFNEVADIIRCKVEMDTKKSSEGDSDKTRAVLAFNSVPSAFLSGTAPFVEKELEAVDHACYSSLMDRFVQLEIVPNIYLNALFTRQAFPIFLADFIKPVLKVIKESNCQGLYKESYKSVLYRDNLVKQFNTILKKEAREFWKVNEKTVIAYLKCQASVRTGRTERGRPPVRKYDHPAGEKGARNLSSSPADSLSKERPIPTCTPPTQPGPIPIPNSSFRSPAVKLTMVPTTIVQSPISIPLPNHNPFGPNQPVTHNPFGPNQPMGQNPFGPISSMPLGPQPVLSTFTNTGLPPPTMMSNQQIPGNQQFFNATGSGFPMTSSNGSMTSYSQPPPAPPMDKASMEAERFLADLARRDSRDKKRSPTGRTSRHSGSSRSDNGRRTSGDSQQPAIPGMAQWNQPPPGSTGVGNQPAVPGTAQYNQPPPSPTTDTAQWNQPGPYPMYSAPPPLVRFPPPPEPIVKQEPVEPVTAQEKAVPLPVEQNVSQPVVPSAYTYVPLADVKRRNSGKKVKEEVVEDEYDLVFS